MSGYELNKKQIYFLLGFISMVYLMGIAVLGDMQSLWMDDIAQIQIASQRTLKLMIKENIGLDNNPPLSHFLSFFWIRMVPYGTGWLKLFSVIFVAVGLFVCGLIAYDMAGVWAGIATACLVASNTGLVTLAAYTFRPYGLLFYLCALMMLAYERSRRQFSCCGNAAYLTVMLLAVYTHYFAVLVSIVFFIFDCCLVRQKKLKFYHLYVYPVAALGVLPWLAAVAYSSFKRIQNFWPSKPDLKTVMTMWRELNGNDRFYVYVLFILTLLFVVGEAFSLFKKKSSVFNRMLIAVPCTVIVIVYALSRYVDSITSLFVSRYFICVMPQVCIAGGIGMERAIRFILDRVKKVKMRRIMVSLVAVLLVLMFVRNELRVFANNQGLVEPFQEIADYLLDQGDIHSPEVLVFNTCYNLQTGWDYYLTHKNTRQGVNAAWSQLNYEDLTNISKIYLVSLHLPLERGALEILEENGFKKDSEDSYLPVQIYVRNNR